MSVSTGQPESDGIPSAVVWGILGLALAVGAWLRLQGIDRSLGHDEVFSWVAFASKPWAVIPSSYEAPNNHIFHTLCVKLSATVFGNSDWAIRLPAVTAGIAVVAFSFSLARALTGSFLTALVASLLMALCQGQVSASIQARGYTLLVLMSMLQAWCAWWAVEAVRSREAVRWWVGCAVCGFLAVLTVPSGIYLVAAVHTWGGVCLLRTAWSAEHRDTRSARLIWPFVAASAIMIAMVAVVYLPLREQLELLSRQWGIPVSENPGALVDIWLGVLTLASPSRWPLVSLAFGLLGVGVLAFERVRTMALILLIISLPFALNLLMGVAGPSRVYAFATPFLVLLVARGVTAVPWLLQRLGPGWGSNRRRSISLVAATGVATASFLPASWDGPADTRYRQFGQMIAQEAGHGDLVVAPYIMDSSLGYYTDGLLVDRVREIVLKRGLQRLLLVARSGEQPRYSLSDYMLTTNFTTAQTGHTDRYREYELPAAAFRVVLKEGNLRLFESLQAPGAVLGGPELLAADAWQVYYESHPKTTKVSDGVDATGTPKLTLISSDKGTFVLHSTVRYNPGTDGLLLLAYTKSAAEGAYASLYQAGSAVGSEDLWAVQMAKPLSQTVELDGGVERAFAELYLIQVRAQRHYGLYVYSRGQDRQSFGDFALYFVPYQSVSQP
jgi:hypothetical protein